MGKTEKKLACLLCAGISLLFLLIDLSLVYGFLFGSVISMIIYQRTERFCTTLLSNQIANKGYMYLNFMINFGMMALTLLICALKPELFNIFAAALGLLLIKAAIIIHALFRERRKNRDPS